MKHNIVDLSDRTNMFYWQTNRNITPKQNKQIFLTRHTQVSKTDAIQAIKVGMQTYGLSKKEASVIYISDPIALGNINNVFSATLQNGMEIVARMHPRSVKNGYFWVEKVVAEKATEKGVPSYETYYIDDSKKHVDFDFMLMERLPGQAIQHLLPLSQKKIQYLMNELGSLCARFHQVSPNGFGFMSNNIAKNKIELVGQYDRMLDHFYSALDEDLAYLVHESVFTPKHEQVIRSIFSQHEALLSIKKASLIHNDIADWNVLSDGTNITGIIDWDESCAGDPIMDFAQFSLFYDKKRMNPFIAGYESVSPLPDNFERKLHIYRLRYVVSKLHLRKKRSKVDSSPLLVRNLKRGIQVMEEEFSYFNI